MKKGVSFFIILLDYFKHIKQLLTTNKLYHIIHYQ